MPTKTKKKAAPTVPYTIMTPHVRMGFLIMSVLFIFSFAFYAFVMFVMNSMSVQFDNRITELESKVSIQRSLINAITPTDVTK